MPTSSSKAIARARACLAFMPMCRRKTSAIWNPTVKTGFNEVIGSWKIIEISLPHRSRLSFRLMSSKLLPSKIILLDAAMLEVSGGNKPITASELTDLPLPDSPTKATVVLRGMLKEIPLTVSTLSFLLIRKDTRKFSTTNKGGN